MNSFLRIWKKIAFIILLWMLLAGWFDQKIALGGIICMAGPVTLALLGNGRFWCNYICPRGSLYDGIVSKFSNKKATPIILKSKGFRIFVILFMFSMVGCGIKNNWGDIKHIGMVFYMMIVITTFIGIFLGFIFNHRAWCSFCPMGSIASFIAYLQKKH